ncbi:MAG: GMP synthase, partial [Myxococcota bacterium]|nr:GMP synthase [Myxococcota bacterium]
MTAATSPHILIVKTGTTDPGVVRDHGDYDEWFQRELREGGARHTVVEAHTGATLPDPCPYDGIILTGSPLSVRDEAPWMSSLGRWTLHAADTVPVLAVCFGLQLVGEALGGHIAPNPAGGEYGTIRVALTEAGRAHPLFEGLGDTLQVQSTHRDVLVRPPLASRTVLLATTPNTH